MAGETALFWLVVAAFLFFDNLIIVPHGCDVLRLDRRGAIRYDASNRMSGAGREMVLLNPLDLFDRGLISSRCFGDVQPRHWRQSRAWLKSALPVLNALSILGYFYLLAVVFLAFASFRVGFTPALIGFVSLHATFWTSALLILILYRGQLQFSGSAVVGAAAEAFFVPAYLMNLGKRLLYKRKAQISCLGLGLRELKRTTDADERELFALRLRQRLEVLEMIQGYESNDPTTEKHIDKPKEVPEVDPAPWHTSGCIPDASSDQTGEMTTNKAHTPIQAQVQLSATQIWIMKAKACLKT